MKQQRREDIRHLTPEQIQSIADRGAKLFDSFTIDTKNNLDVKAAFILGMLHGTEKTFDELGFFDSNDDNIYDFIEKHSK